MDRKNFPRRVEARRRTAMRRHEQAIEFWKRQKIDEETAAKKIKAHATAIKNLEAKLK